MIEFPSVPETAVFHCGGKDARERMSICELRRRNELSGDRRQPDFSAATRDFKSYFEGKIREARVWNRTLSDAEIQPCTIPAPSLRMVSLLSIC
jgi:hypothetical protein